MEAHRVLESPTTPLTQPVIVPRSPRFVDREYFTITYRTDPGALRAVVPEPLTFDEPLVRFEVMKMGDVDGYGPYTECGQAIPVRHHDEHGEYLHAMHLDSFGATVAGRELSAYPKTMGSPRLTISQGALVGTLDHGGERVATATMAYKWQPMDHDTARAQIGVPTYAVKLVRGYTGEPVTCHLARTEIVDITVKEAWTGPGRLQLFAHVMAPFADLPVLEVRQAIHVRTDLTLAPMTPVHDYLSESGPPG